MKIKITKEQFEDYEEVRVNGLTNMYDITTVCELSGLDKEIVIQIMKEYDKLMEEFPEVRK
ncbi:MAG: hypothetical protein AABY22_10385 [Nanoarchaeota archaeon]